MPRCHGGMAGFSLVLRFFFLNVADIALSKDKAITDFLLSATETFHHVFLVNSHKGLGGGVVQSAIPFL